MSAYAEAQTEFKDAELLVKALAECGYPIVEVNTTAQTLYGHHGDVRPETAEIIIRRQHVGTASNDVGFKRNPDTGKYGAIVSEFDRNYIGLDNSWLAKVKASYCEAGIMREASRKGLRFTGRKLVNGKVQLDFVKVGR